MEHGDSNSQALHVCLVSQEYPPETGGGGIGTYTYHLAHGLTRAGHQVEVVSLSTDSTDHVYLDGQVRVHRLATRRISLKLGRRWFYFIKVLERSYTVARRLRRLVREAGVQVVEAPNWDAEAFFYTWRQLTPLIVRTATPLAEVIRVDQLRPNLDLRVRLWLERATVRRADRVIAFTRSIAQANQTHYGTPLSRMHIIPLGLVDQLSGKQALKARSDEHRPRIVLFVGRLEPRKGIKYVLEAIPRVLAQVPATRFIITGRDSPTAPGGQFWREYFRQTCVARYREAVSFTGFVPREELRRLYQHCDVFVAPSLYESFGLVHLEAMSWGAPVVAFRTAATPEVVIGGVTGLLVEPGDVDSLAEGLVTLLRNPQMAEAMGMAGRERSRSQFSVEQMIEKSEAVYHQVVRGVQG